MDATDRTAAYDVTSLDDLAKIYARPSPRIATKETDYITEVGRAFIAASPFLVLATSNGTSLDCSPKGDAPGFVQLLDERTLLIPDRPGNNRIDGMKNLIVNPKVGIISMVPGSNETYRVNGTARISTDPELLKRFEVCGKLPRVVIVVTVEEAFNHCPKALIRAKLWDAAARPSGAPTHGDFAAARDGKDAAYAREYNEKYAERLKTELY
ncbi:MAG TPA: MSMEG_1061 family FMN-dependent PPOX-type flavoprotein [candidate division Zixibacteria bacterium]|nr:MSMEG_1061 family FMN-dependent PPOX-type flavoprotein [candidate division Zixibacteria bacterium]